MIERHTKQTCIACLGTGIQTRNDGIRIQCPVCNGTGIKWRSNFDDVPPGALVCVCHTGDSSSTGGY